MCVFLECAYVLSRFQIEAIKVRGEAAQPVVAESSEQQRSWANVLCLGEQTSLPKAWLIWSPSKGTVSGRAHSSWLQYKQETKICVGANKDHKCPE